MTVKGTHEDHAAVPTIMVTERFPCVAIETPLSSVRQSPARAVHALESSEIKPSMIAIIEMVAALGLSIRSLSLEW